MSPMLPMLATATSAPPPGGQWAHEIKWDGMRVLADLHSDRLLLTSRNGNDVTASFPELTSLTGLYDDLLLDGEVVAFEDGRPSFAALAERMHVKDRRRAAALAATRPVTYVVFDVLRLFGQDLTGQPWSARRELLERLALEAAHVQVPPAYDDGAELLAATAAQGLEGVVSKRRSSGYHPGRRSSDWLKTSHRATISAVVGGWRPETGNASRLGAVLIGIPTPVGLRYAGRMGSGLAGRAGAMMAGLLTPLTRADSPFAEALPATEAKEVTWVEPRIVVEVRALGSTGAGRLRHPTYVGLRPDLEPDDLLTEGRP